MADLGQLDQSVWEGQLLVEPAVEASSEEGAESGVQVDSKHQVLVWLH